MMRITQDFLNHLSPVELSFIRTGIDKLYKEKVTPDTTTMKILNHIYRDVLTVDLYTLCRMASIQSSDRNADARTAVQYSWQLPVLCLHIQEQALILSTESIFQTTQRLSMMTVKVFRHLYLKMDLKVMSFHLVNMCHRMEIQYHQ